jgi:hypothetical protein
MQVSCNVILFCGKLGGGQPLVWHSPPVVTRRREDCRAGVTGDLRSVTKPLIYIAIILTSRRDL